MYIQKLLFNITFNYQHIRFGKIALINDIPVKAIHYLLPDSRQYQELSVEFDGIKSIKCVHRV